MVRIKNYENKKLEVGAEFYKDKELEFTISNTYGDEMSVWLKKEDVKRLIAHLQSVLQPQGICD